MSYISTASSASPSSNVFTTNFTFATSSPMLLQMVAAGHVLYRASILITTPFDDPAATLLLGTTASPSLVLGAADSFPDVVDQYDSQSIYKFSGPDFLQLTINPGTSTQGAGLLLWEYD